MLDVYGRRHREGRQSIENNEEKRLVSCLYEISTSIYIDIYLQLLNRENEKDEGLAEEECLMKKQKSS